MARMNVSNVVGRRGQDVIVACWVVMGGDRGNFGEVAPFRRVGMGEVSISNVKSD